MAVESQAGIARRTLRTAKRLLRRAFARLGTVLLRFSPSRRLLNWAYEETFGWIRIGIDRAFSDSPIPHEFEWICRFGPRQIVMPVLPSLQRSWNAALAWRWSGNRAVRQLYRIYFDHRREGVFFDVGANDGTHSFLFALHGYRCVCFEPQPSCIQHIERVCRRNRFDNLTALAVLVGDPKDEAEQSVEFFLSDSSWVSSRSREHVERFQDRSTVVRVPCLTLDRYCHDRQIQPTLIKVDVESGEWEALSGGRGVIEQLKPDLFVEIVARNHRKADLWSWFNSLGYQVLVVDHFARRPFRSIGDLGAFMSVADDASDYLFSCDPDLLGRLQVADISD